MIMGGVAGEREGAEMLGLECRLSNLSAAKGVMPCLIPASINLRKRMDRRVKPGGDGLLCSRAWF
jgi:hypothetical protein